MEGGCGVEGEQEVGDVECVEHVVPLLCLLLAEEPCLHLQEVVLSEIVGQVFPALSLEAGHEGAHGGQVGGYAVVAPGVVGFVGVEISSHARSGDGVFVEGLDEAACVGVAVVVVEDDGYVGASVHREVGDTSLGLVEVELLHGGDVGVVLQGFGHAGAEVEVAEGRFAGEASLVFLAVLVVVVEFLAVEVADALAEHGEHVFVFLALRAQVGEQVGHVFAHGEGDVVGGFHALEP